MCPSAQVRSGQVAMIVLSGTLTPCTKHSYITRGQADKLQTISACPSRGHGLLVRSRWCADSAIQSGSASETDLSDELALPKSRAGTVRFAADHAYSCTYSGFDITYTLADCSLRLRLSCLLSVRHSLSKRRVTLTGAPRLIPLEGQLAATASPVYYHTLAHRDA